MMGTNIPIAKVRHSVHAAAHEEESSGSVKLVATILPWMMSILVHVAFVLIAVFCVYSTMEQQPPKEELVTTIKFAPTLGHAAPLKGFGKTTEAGSQGGRRISSTASSEPQQLPQARSLGGIGFTSGNADSKGVFIPGAKSSTTGSGVLFDIGNGPGGGTPDGIGTVRINGGPRARSFVFVIDGSGSMLDTLPFVNAELKRVIRSLDEDQSFTVLYYQNDAVIEAHGSGLRAGTTKNKSAVFDWLDSDAIAPMGLSNPVKAIEQGLRYKPHVMFLLSDNITGSGRYELHQGELLSRVERANAVGTKINTVQFLHPDPLLRIQGMKATMEMISQKSGGSYRYFSAAELGL